MSVTKAIWIFLKQELNLESVEQINPFSIVFHGNFNAKSNK